MRNIAIVFMLILSGCQKFDKHSTNYEIESTFKNPLNEVITIKALLSDKDIRDINSYKGLGAAICNSNGEGSDKCDVVFTSRKFEKNVSSILPETGKGYIAAFYSNNSKQTSTIFSCFFVNDTNINNCSTELGNNLVIEYDKMAEFEFQSVFLTDNAGGGDIVHKNGDSRYTKLFNIYYYKEYRNKLTDEVASPAMYAMDLTWVNLDDLRKSLNLSCIKGSNPVMRLSEVFTDKYVGYSSDPTDLNREIRFRLDDNSPSKLKQSVQSFIITQHRLKGHDIILSPSETATFAEGLSKSNKLILGEHFRRNDQGIIKSAQAEINLKGFAESWGKLKALCNI